jgi:CheY-like chemotaxis protein
VGVRDEATDQTPARELPRTTGVRVLIVEDNPDAADSLEALLDFLGHRVRIAGDGPRALALARTEPPDVMLIDIGLPGMDGYEVARHVRQDARLTGVLLVALTGYGRAEDRAEALAAGFDRHLVKPVDAGTLQELVAARTRDAAGA